MVSATPLPINTGASAAQMANEIFGTGVTVVSASYTGDNRSSGIYSNGDSVSGTVTPGDSGVILSTGRANRFTNNGGQANQSTSRTSGSNGVNNDADFNALAGTNTYDASWLDIDFIPTGDTLTMQFVFSSDEFPEYAGSIYNDAIGVWVNGAPATISVGDGSVTAGNLSDINNLNLYIDNTADQFNTEMDGFTVTLTLTMTVLPGVLNSIRIGWVVGGWLARSLAHQFAEFFTFPYLIFSVSLWVYALAGLSALLTTTIGAARSALAAARLAPAIAMQPPAPPRFKRSLLDEAMAWLRLSQPSIMILRSLLRWPLRSALTSFGLALAVAAVIAAGFLDDALDTIVDTAFYQSNRQDAVLIFSEDVSEIAVESTKRLPGVLSSEGQQFHSAVLRSGALSKRVPIEARRPGTDLSRVVDANGQVLDALEGGILLSKRLASELEIDVGTSIEVEFLSGNRETFMLTVSGVVEQYFGLGAYVDLAYLNRLLRQAPQISVVNVSLDRTYLDDLHSALKEVPKLTVSLPL